MGVPEDEREQDIENILKEIVTENFLHLVTELDLTSPGSAENSKQKESKEDDTKTNHN